MRIFSQRLLARPAVRQAANNLSWLVAERGVRLISGLLVGLWVTRYLGPARFGLLGYALALVGLGIAIAEAGVEAIVRREVVRDAAGGGSWLAAAARVRLMAGAACYLILVGWLALRGESKSGEEAVVLLIVGLQLFQPGLTVVELWLQANLQARLSVRAQLAGLIIGSLGRLGLLLAEAPLWAFAAMIPVEMIAVVFFLRRFASRAGWRPGKWQTPGVALGQLMAEAWPLLLSGLTVTIYIRIDLVMVRHLLGESQAGIYAAAVRLSEIGFFLPAALATSLLPSLLRAKADSPQRYDFALQRSFDLQAALAYCYAVPVVLLSPLLVRLAYGASFAPAAPILAVHAWTLLWASLGVARGQYCVNENLTRLHLTSTMVGALMNVGLNGLLIPRLGGVGAAWATLGAQITAAWLSSFCFSRLRGCAFMQLRALFIPFRWVRYVAPKA